MSEDLKLPELAARLDAILRPLTPKGERRKDYWGQWDGWSARYTGGRFLEVRTGWTQNLTKAEAAHYLWGLENGYVGPWRDYVQENPVPTHPVYRVVLVRLDFTDPPFQLYGVQRETAQRLLGVVLKPVGRVYCDGGIDKKRVVLEDATEGERDTLNAMWKDQEDAIRCAKETFRNKLDDLRQERKR